MFEQKRWYIRLTARKFIQTWNQRKHLPSICCCYIHKVQFTIFGQILEIKSTDSLLYRDNRYFHSGLSLFCSVIAICLLSCNSGTSWSGATICRCRHLIWHWVLDNYRLEWSFKRWHWFWTLKYNRDTVLLPWHYFLPFFAYGFWLWIWLMLCRRRRVFSKLVLLDQMGFTWIIILLGQTVVCILLHNCVK